MIILCPGGFCGMSPKAGATVAAVYMILVTNMYLIFEVGHFQRAMLEMEKIKPFNNMTSMGKMLPYCYYTAFMLAVMTYPVCILLLYSVHKRHCMGMFAYVAWITFYDLTNCLLVALLYQISKEAWFSLSPLEWFGLGTRIPTDCFWLSFVVTHALLLSESKGQGRMSLRPRRVSRNVSEPPRFRLGSTVRKGL
ncbi:transmembrane protein 217 [Pelodiscus sinensis]|uniref:Transmembrane protein 217 n=1 Tax=Pelodiscus sinensis TaxID=13735 RepID=K7EYW7_PELSI|nr:transmembrane protein 217 [Pelodiscus sinensis]XP_025033565.1 transmembrane protein 217 [Pelodiscus sinensis]XP_025033566.1 transmembrane protein 217 [Pelodiscus sinensis]|eukprot:XP_006135797.1 transmembrane protein 217 [Pelodiscus sinensis]